MYLIGYDIGSSSIKATLLDAESGKVISSVTSPEKEMDIIAVKHGWAEQEPWTWWENVVTSTKKMLSNSKVNPSDIKAIGISYQMHGLVVVDVNHNVLRPSIIWCDSRAVEIGEKAFADIGHDKCLCNFLNSPGNFTASKLKWVKDNEPELYKRIYKIMLPGDYIAMKLSGEIKTSQSGLSEGILWNYKTDDLATEVLEYYGINEDIVSESVPSFSIQGELTKDAAVELGLNPGTLISYRAGDQPNNALSLNVLNPGEIAATAGTSGVVYSVTDKAEFDPKSRVNTFLHVNHTKLKPRYGVLLCINGTGILNRWLKDNIMAGSESDIYGKMNDLASKIPAGSEGLLILPYGNGAERSLENRNIGSSIHNLEFNTHNKGHLIRAAQEGIVFALNYGIEITRAMGVHVDTVRAGNANMFLSPVFREVFATVTDSVVELFDTDGAQGAARGAGIGAGIYKTPEEAFTGLKPLQKIEPDFKNSSRYKESYLNWKNILESKLKGI